MRLNVQLRSAIVIVVLCGLRESAGSCNIVGFVENLVAGYRVLPQECTGILAAYHNVSQEISAGGDVNPAKLVSKIFDALCPKLDDLLPCYNAVVKAVGCSSTDLLLEGVPNVPPVFQDATFADAEFYLNAMIAVYKIQCDKENNPLWSDENALAKLNVCAEKIVASGIDPGLYITELYSIDFTTGGKPLSDEDCRKFDSLMVTVTNLYGEPKECEDFYPFVKESTSTLTDYVCGRENGANRASSYWAAVAVMSAAAIVNYNPIVC
ncbi:PREDICTED: uncharacterized protein LOC106808730 [Priapulus caudatus]|uniref:Uncharacterized protein LOC106808730 n=1 Tax=Priapulus caudatus TaxID=37621 RepID=A0ABM1E4C7_PRICU|nr:PREDICTED: uncharacterized protein LOC106808730 [Priapulus caudatus]